MAEGDAPKLGFEVDTSGLTKAQSELAKTEKATDDVGYSFEQLDKKTAELKQRLEALNASLQGPIRSGAELDAKMALVHKAFNEGTISAQKQEQVMKVLQDSFKETSERAQALAHLIGQDIGSGLAGSFGVLGVSMQKATQYAVTLVGPAGVLITGAVAATAAYWKLNEVLARHTDQVVTWQQKLTYAIGTQVQAVDTFNDLEKAAQRTAVPMGVLVDNYAKLSAAGRTVGASRQEMAQFVELISKIGQVSGATPGETSSGVFMLARMMAQGNIEGRALYSMLTHFPGLVTEIAKGLGVSVEQLKLMGQNGELSGKKLFDALLSRKPDVEKMFEEMPEKFQDATVKMSNAWDSMLASMGRKMRSQEVAGGPAKLLTELFTTVGHAVESDPVRRFQNAQQAYITNTANVNAIAAATGAPESERLRMIAYFADALKQAYKEALPFMAGLSGADAASAAANARAPTMRALDVIAERDTLGRQRERLGAEIVTLQGGLGAATPQEAARIQGQIDALKIQLERSGSAFERLARKTQEMTDDMAAYGGTTASMSLGAEARGIYEQSANQNRAVSMGSVVGELLKQRAMTGMADAGNLENQARGIAGRRGAVGASRSEAIAIQAEQATYDWAAQQGLWGRFTNEVVKAMNARIAALVKVSEEEDKTALAESTYRGKIEAANQPGMIAAIGAGGAAERRQAALNAAAQAEQKLPGSGALSMAAFERQEEIRRARSGASLDESLRYQSLQLAAGGNPGALRQAAIEQRIYQAGREGTGGEDKIRAEEANKVRLELAAQSDEMRQQALAARTLAQVVGQNREQEAITTALLEKQRQLRAMNVDIGSEEYDQALKETETLARANFFLAERRREVEALGKVWDVAAEGIQNAITDAFFTSFKKGETVARRFALSLSDMFRRIASELLSATVISPVSNALRNQGFGGLMGLFGLGGGNALGYGTAGTEAATALVPDLAGGMVGVIHQGGVVGESVTPMRMASPGLFYGAPRLHRGLGPNEFPAILERGETVTPKGQRSGGDFNVTNIITVQSTGDAQKDGDVVAAKVSEAMRVVARTVITDELRPGGVLAK
ncbi:MAG TPA: tape measure protein [Burkholderiales bacterium]